MLLILIFWAPFFNQTIYPLFPDDVSRESDSGPPGGQEVNCPPFRAAGILWDWTLPGRTSTSKCPQGSLGTAKFTCMEEGYWDLSGPDMLGCRSPQVAELEEMVSHTYSPKVLNCVDVKNDIIGLKTLNILISR